MKFSHNKKRNTAFIYEMLIMEFSRASINKDETKKQNILSILKEYFSDYYMEKRKKIHCLFSL